MNWEWELCGFSRSGDRFQKSCRRGGAAALGDEDIARFHILLAQLTQRSDFLVAHGTPGARFSRRQIDGPESQARFYNSLTGGDEHGSNFFKTREVAGRATMAQGG